MTFSLMFCHKLALADSNLCIRQSVLTVLCCHPAPVPCRETVRVLCRLACSPLLPPAGPPVGCRCIAPSETWPEAELRGETLMLVPDLPLTTPATGSTWGRKTVNRVERN